jgi:hypothetical protein
MSHIVTGERAVLKHRSLVPIDVGRVFRNKTFAYAVIPSTYAYCQCVDASERATFNRMSSGAGCESTWLEFRVAKRSNTVVACPDFCMLFT